MEAVMDDIVTGRGGVSEVVLTGSSAGALAALLHCDSWSPRFANETGGKAKVTCLPDGGFFMDYGVYRE